MFMNLVLAGCGAKGVAYVGVARALEEHGIWNNIRRFAGTNTGSILAALFCVGFNSYDVEALMPVTIELLYRDSWRISRTAKSGGWHPAEKFKKYMEAVLVLKTNKPNITFQQVHDEYNEKELCITATNADKTEVIKFNRTTSKDMPILEAIWKSIYFPGEDRNKGVLCNYPIDCFDDTWQPLESLECLAYSEGPRVDPTQMNWPTDSKLSREWKSQDERKYLTDVYAECQDYQKTFSNVFESKMKEKFSLKEFEQTFEQIPIKKNVDDRMLRARLYAEMMYGLDVTANTILEDMKKSDKLNVTIDELKDFLKEKSNLIEGKYDAVKDKPTKVDDINNLSAEKMKSLQKDSARTIGINTGYICASDFSMENCDIEFLIKQGKDSTEKFVQLHKLSKKTKSLTEAEIANIRRDYSL